MGTSFWNWNTYFHVAEGFWRFAPFPILCLGWLRIRIRFRSLQIHNAPKLQNQVKDLDLDLLKKQLRNKENLNIFMIKIFLNLKDEICIIIMLSFLLNFVGARVLTESSCSRVDCERLNPWLGSHLNWSSSNSNYCSNKSSQNSELSISKVQWVLTSIVII